jgi:glycine cleavage system transcriptional repressor
VTKRFAVAVMGQDRPGIVASVSSTLLDLHCNVEDVATSILRGHFAMMLVVAGADDLNVDKVTVALQPLSSGDLSFDVWPVHAALESVQATHAITVYGPDTSGIVNAVGETMADLGVNICDMVCKLHEGEPAVYVLTVEVAIPASVGVSEVQSRLASAVEPLGLESTIRSVERAEL